MAGYGLAQLTSNIHDVTAAYVHWAGLPPIFSMWVFTQLTADIFDGTAAEVFTQLTADALDVTAGYAQRRKVQTGTSVCFARR